MNFAFETPVEYLKQFDKICDYHFILAQHCKNKDYFNFYRESTKYKILDNGAAELDKSISEEIIIKLAVDLKVDVVVAPDVLYNSVETTIRTTEFLNRFSKYKTKFKIMAIPQGNSFFNWLDCFLRFYFNLNIDIIGLPYKTLGKIWKEEQKEFSPTKARIFIVNKLLKKYNKKPYHLLGLGHNGQRDIKNSLGYNNIKTIDTSIPFVYALSDSNKSCKDWVRKEYKPLNIDLKFNKKIFKKALDYAKYLKGVKI